MLPRKSQRPGQQPLLLVTSPAPDRTTNPLPLRVQALISTVKATLASKFINLCDEQTVWSSTQKQEEDMG